jgi:hypothetical protein
VRPDHLFFLTIAASLGGIAITLWAIIRPFLRRRGSNRRRFTQSSNYEKHPR